MTRVLFALTLLTAAGLVACAPADEDEGPRFISPLDGQTGWDVDQPLTVLATDMSLPPDYPLPELIRVVELDDSGLVPGTTVRTSAFLTFTPDGAFGENRRYAWVVDVPPPVAHGPELTFPEALQEPAVFDTRPTIDVLGGSIDGDGRACVVLSKVLDGTDGGSWRIEVEDQLLSDVIGYLVPRAEWGPDLDLPLGDPGVDVLCLDFSASGNPDPTAPAPLDPGQLARLYWGAQGPWLIELADGDIVEEVVRLRRGVQ